VHLRKTFENDGTFFRVFCQFPNVEGFLAGESESAHAVRAEFEDACRGDGRVSECGFEAAEDDAGYTSAHLLVDNGSDESFENRLVIVDFEGSGPAYNGGQDGIFFQMFDGCMQWVGSRTTAQGGLWAH